MPWGQDYLFKDRRDAGRQLAQALVRYRDAPQTIVLGLPRGGVVVAYEISLALHLPLDVLVTRKLGTPGNPELAMGALAETGYRYLNRDVLDSYDVPARELEEEIGRQQREIARRIERYRQGRALPALAGDTVILVDDGIATGATFYASLAALREMKVGRLVAAVPVGPDRAREDLRELVDEVVILHTPSSFYGIGQFYADFHQIDDEEVLACLEGMRAALKRTPPPQEPGRSG
ncbi:putative phosphoribosyltransferase [Nitrospira tepida]|uniref:Phosphoribosyltransferase n=1 Tax=Nitrospira tepida TaxID=2973512 RepID=A0AA86T976_9BACT|nr:phosphoribosyltransferase [Nitrospira tepida]CAI4034006.1 putative phosphoribosyltransferase [Nitrospira tepida]